MAAILAQLATLKLDAQTAADLMTPNPISIRANATIGEAKALLTDRGFGAAPVIDDAGHPIGVVSSSDILAHDREQRGSQFSSSSATGCDQTLVRDIMTPVVFSVALDTAANRVVQEMVGLKVHRLFVVDTDGNLIGVITALDVLRKLHN
jgi:CBS domain-containing protein